MDRNHERWLVRHAQSAGNAAGTVQGQRRGIGLTPLGRLQATRLAADFTFVEWSAPPLVVSSDLRRAVETAHPVAQRIGVRLHTDKALRERRFGVLEGKPWNEAAAADIGLVDGAVADPGARPRRGESVRDVQERVASFLQRLIDRHPDRPLVVVTHGGPIRVLRGHLAGIPLEGMPWYRVANAVPEPLFPAEADFATGRDGTAPVAHV